MNPPDEPVRSRIPIKANQTVRSFGRVANWTVGVAAAALVLISVGGYFYHREQLTAIAAEHLRLVVTGPARLHTGVAAEYMVSTTAINGQPLPTQIEVVLLGPDGKRLKANKEPADRRGRLLAVIPANMRLPSQTTLRVVASHADSRQQVEIPLAVEPVRYTTRLMTDKLAYQPGETIRYRSLTLSRFTLTASPKAPIRFEILDPRGNAMSNSTWDTITDHGVGSGTFTIPDDLADGQYTLVVHGVEQALQPRRPFVIRRPISPRLKKELEFTRDSYGPGDKVTASFRAERIDGGAAAGVRLNVLVTVDGQSIFQKVAQTSDAGSLQIQFNLPENIRRGDGQLTLAIDSDGAAETHTERIPFRPDRVDVTFYPEGGHLVASLENRVYFVARTPLGKPVQLAGMVVATGRGDGAPDREIAAVNTTVDGMGAFTLTPRAGETYRLKIASPKGVENEPTLPETSSKHYVTLTTGQKPVAAGKPLECILHAAKTGLPLVVVAYCRGVQVGQQPLVTKAGTSDANPVTIPLAPAIGGVIRLAVYDYSIAPPILVAERPIYRQLANSLNVRPVEHRKWYTPGETVDFSLLVTDEQGKPVPAALGLSAFDDAQAAPAHNRMPAMPAQFLLNDVLQPKYPAADDPFLSGESARDEAAASAFDLWLGTQPASDGHLVPPAMFDNINQLRSDYQKSLTGYQADRTRTLSTLTTASFFGGLGLVLLVAMLGLMRIVSGMHLWIPAVGSTTCCLILGAILMDPGRLAIDQELIPAFSSYHPPVPAPDTDQTDTYNHGLIAPAEFTRENPVANRDSLHPDATGDSTNTLLWNPLIIAGSDGKASVHFKLPDTPAVVRLTVDAHGNGRLGSGHARIISRPPFRLEPKLPGQINAGDRIEAALTVANDTEAPFPLEVDLKHGDLVQLDGSPQRTIDLAANRRTCEYFILATTGQRGTCDLTFRGKSGSLTDTVGRSLQITPPGFPVSQSFSGQIDGRRELVVTLPERWTPGSLEVELNAFPTVLADLQTAIDDILDQPDGCFEQVLALSCLGAMTAQYAEDHNLSNPAIIRRAKDVLREACTKLPAYECKQQGYEWFGGDPGHEALTAYALMQFHDIRQAHQLDPAMIGRTVSWLLNRRDGKGGFQRNPETPGQLVQATPELTDAYITWALSESGQERIDAEIERTLELGRQSDDPYLVALAATVALNAGNDDQRRSLLAKLAAAQADDGHLDGRQNSITHGGGQSLRVETTALATLAWLRLPEFSAQADRAVQWIIQNRRGGRFGSTQATILALKALVQYAKNNHSVPNAGTLIVLRDGLNIGQHTFTAGVRETIAIDGLETSLTAGDNRLVINLTGNNRMAYTLNVRYHAFKPANDAACPVQLTANLAESRVNAGSTVALTAVLTNTTDQNQPMTVAVVGLPAGLQPRPQQLEELKKAGTVDHYETRERELIFYWRALKPKQQTSLKFDLSAAFPGQYTGSASRSYLYHTPDNNQWCNPLAIEITRDTR